MSLYDILTYCQECRTTHPMGVAVEVDGAPRRRTSLRAMAAAGGIPPAVSQIVGSPVLCPKTGRPFVTRDLSRVYLQPLERKPQAGP